MDAYGRIVFAARDGLPAYRLGVQCSVVLRTPLTPGRMKLENISSRPQCSLLITRFSYSLKQ